MLKKYGHIVIDISVLILFKNTVGEHVVQVFSYFLKNDYFFEEQDLAKIIVNEIVFLHTTLELSNTHTSLKY